MAFTLFHQAMAICQRDKLDHELRTIVEEIGKFLVFSLCLPYVQDYYTMSCFPIALILFVEVDYFSIGGTMREIFLSMGLQPPAPM